MIIGVAGHISSGKDPMTKISAEIVADSFSPQGDRLTSLLITFPRIILAEVNTHRMLSKNTSSSRAIPLNKMIEAVQKNPFIPIAWQKKHSGMQGSKYFDNHFSITGNYNLDTNYGFWMDARDEAVRYAECLGNEGLTKQLANRLLEPFMWTTMLITGSEEGWDNFFNLRCPSYVDASEKTHKSKKDYNFNFIDESWRTNLQWLNINKGQAEIHMMDLAEKIYDAVNESTPLELESGAWHIPFEDKLSGNNLSLEEMIKCSVAMVARTSYTVVGDEKEIDYQKMIDLHDKLIIQNPPHSSPMEHCARAMSDEEYYSSIKTTSYPLHIPQNKEDVEVNGGFVNKELYPQHKQYGKNVDKTMYGWCRNIRGFIQYRHILEEGGSL